MFGSYISFIVVSPKDASSSEVLSEPENKRRRLNEQKESAAKKVPPLLSKEKNKKDVLYNDLLKFLSGHGLGWEEPDVYGKSFVTNLCNLLWYVDGHHQVFASRSCDIPLYFSSFSGYNCPERSKHRKRSISNMNRDKLLEYTSVLNELAMSSWLQQPEWSSLRVALIMFIESVTSYASYLAVRNKAMKVHHSSPEPTVSFSDASNIRYMEKLSSVSPLLSDIDTAVKNSKNYEIVYVSEFAPLNKRKKYLFIRELENGLLSNAFLLTYTHGSNVGNYHFVWKAPENVCDTACASENLRLIEKIKKDIPVYHTRAMKREFFSLCGRISPKSKPYVLRSIYCTLTGDHTSSRTTAEAEIDERVSEALAMQDPDIILDLRECNTNGQDRYSVFWEKCAEFSKCTSVHERRHDTTSFMAKAISVRDLVEQVSKFCPPNTPIPSTSWVRLNFCPRNPRAKVSSRYKSRLEAKHMVQKRQFRKSHPDAHYCAAIFRYMRDYAVKYRDISVFVCIDDKHRIKVGEPNYPVAAVERGREVIVSLNETFIVGDHDFCKFSLIPSVVMINEIPPSIEEGSWYRGQVYVGIKDAAFQPSSPIRHATELYNILKSKCLNSHILFLYADGGPDHRLTYFTVQLSLIALFLKMDFDVLIAGRTAPSHSWANPVERIMSIVNLGLQSIGIMRSQMDDSLEKNFNKCKSLKSIRTVCSSFQDDVQKSLSPAKELIYDVVKRLELKGQKFDIFRSASNEEISEFWQTLLLIEKSLKRDDTSQDSLKTYPSLQQFIAHCCTFRKYSITIKECGSSECSLCFKVKINPNTFAGIWQIINYCIMLSSIL